MNRDLSFLGEVANWSKEAKDEDTTRYFYHFSDVNSITSGRKNYVIGRKGTGKTAIAEYIREKEGDKSFSRLLSFKNFPFNLLYSYGDSDFVSTNQFITIWEYVIYNCICDLMSKNKCINFDARDKLARIFNFDIELALPNTIKKITERGFGINVFGVGGNVTPASQNRYELPISDRKTAVENYVFNNIDESTYYILFDALDEDYKDIFEPDKRERYFDLLIGLFKAAQNVRHVSSRVSNANIVPVIFLRDEIFELCRDNDKNKWLDRAVELKWSPSRLQNLIAFRLSRAMSSTAEARPFNQIWPLFFESQQIRGNRRRAEPVFNRLLRDTYHRPRDIINFVKECAQVAVDLGEDRITNEMIPEASTQQSAYMRREIIDEVYPIIDDISEIMELLREISKPILSQSEFITRYEEEFRSKSKHQMDGKTVLKTLFHFNVIGAIGPGNRQFFRYSSAQGVLSPNSNICLHRGFLRALDM